MFRLLLSVLFSALLAVSCSKPKDFTVEGTLTDGSTINMRAIYIDNGHLENSVFPTDKGSFTLRGSSADGTIVELLTNDYRVLGRFYAKDGDKIKLKIDPKSPNKISVEGNEVSQRWAKLINDNARLLDSRDRQGINAFVAKYVAAHRDDLVATLLLLTAYDWAADPAGAEKLLLSIAPEARPSSLVDGYSMNLARVGKRATEARIVPFSYLDERDSLANFNPRRQKLALLSFSDDRSGRADSIVPGLKRIWQWRGGDTRLRVIDFSLDGDTLTWRRGVRRDSTAFDHGWVAGSVAAPAFDIMGIQRLPFFLVVDSTGTQLYRGPSITQAEKTLKSKL